MRIAIEASWLNSDRVTGVGYYIYHLLCQLRQLTPDSQFDLLYTGEQWKGPDLGSSFRTVSYSNRCATFGILFSLHRTIKSIKPDLYHATFPTRVPPWKTGVPTITTVHDLLPMRIERGLPRWHFYLLSFGAWRNTDLFLCDSQATASDLKALKGTPDERIRVVPLASAHKLPSWAPPGKHILFVGSMAARKRPLLLFDAYVALCKKMPDPPPLIFVGDERDQGRLLNDELKRLPDNGHVEWLSYVDQEQLTGLYQNACFLAMPSIFEGFGMPVLEALSAGLPVVCTDLPVFREVAGSAALYVKQHTPAVWAEAMTLLLTDLSHCKSLSRDGIEISKSFSWQRCAEETWDGYNTILQP